MPPPQRASRLTDDHRREAVKWLAEHGPSGPMKIAEACGIPQGSITAVLDHPWFNRNQQGVHITPEARREVL